MNSIEFFANFLRDRNVASVMPTSRFGVKRICRHIDFRKDNVIVEYGPGEGVISRQVLRMMTPGSKLILIETNKRFAELLSGMGDKRVFVFNDSAENAEKLLAECGEKSADYVVSGIPFSFFDRKLKRRIIRKTHSMLKPGGKFLVYQMHRKIGDYLEEQFDEVNRGMELVNLPPLRIFEAVRR